MLSYVDNTTVPLVGIEGLGKADEDQRTDWCFVDHIVLSLDVMDISGETLRDIQHDIVKTRIDQDGNTVEALTGGREFLFSKAFQIESSC